jgi:type VI protein secretion system component VasF
MEKQNESVRDRLLARLPQPENLAAYREETETLMAKHKKALFWGQEFPFKVLMCLAVAVFWLAMPTWGPMVETNGPIALMGIAGLLFFLGAFGGLTCSISRCKVDLLKEVKQVQLQVLELQASLRKTGDESIRQCESAAPQKSL